MILPHSLLTDDRTQRIFSTLKRTRFIVDVGAGIRPCPIFPCEEHICIEPHQEYADILARDWNPLDRRVTIVNGTADILAAIPREDTTVLAFDVIEHMDKADGLLFLKVAEQFPQAVIFTPLGWYEQGDENPDAWGLNGGHWQKHRSAWEPGDFAGWNTRVFEDWHDSGPGAICATRCAS